ncbi:MAG: hypothetical protein KA142_13815, partial [Chromatiaceae bacterium]|nr:hypothetical protein [Chromatiaceae bacterium]
LLILVVSNWKERLRSSLSDRVRPRIGDRPDFAMGDFPMAGGRASVREDGGFRRMAGVSAESD